MQQQELMILISVEICSLWVYDNCKLTPSASERKRVSTANASSVGI